MSEHILRVDKAAIEASYDAPSDEFFRLFLGETMTYSCALFPTGHETLDEAQTSKVDYSLKKLQLQPGQKLLDIGCGWGFLARKAREDYNLVVEGLTLSEHQVEYSRRLAREDPALSIRLQAWEDYPPKPFDRIISIGGFEHFTPPKYSAFFELCRAILPADGLMLLQTITTGKPNSTLSFGRWTKFILDNIFPRGRLPHPEQVVNESRLQGLELIHLESLRVHYVRTLELWASNLELNRADAVLIQGEKRYQDYMTYLRSCAEHFRLGEINVYQFLMRAI